jgi:Lrp/AsnC family leucine-responsive transcriptional regulator
MLPRTIPVVRTDMKARLDRVDVRILRQLQKDSGISNFELAEIVGVSPAACSRRVRKLREAGVILKEMVVVDPCLTGRQMTAFVEVTFERHSAAHKQTFLQRVIDHPDITQCYMVTGDTDMVLVVQISDMDAFDKFRSDLLDSNKNVVRYRTLFSIRRVKFDFVVPICVSEQQ